MKKNLKFLSLLFLTLIFFSCGSTDDENSGETNGTNSNEITFEVNGKAWKTTKLQDDASSKQTVIIVGTNDADKTSIGLLFERSKLVSGTTINYEFQLGVIDEASIVLNKIDADGLPTESDDTPSGTITITKGSKTDVEGTFSAMSSKNKIVNGKFKMKLTKIW